MENVTPLIEFIVSRVHVAGQTEVIVRHSADAETVYVFASLRNAVGHFADMLPLTSCPVFIHTRA